MVEKLLARPLARCKLAVPGSGAKAWAYQGQYGYVDIIIDDGEHKPRVS